MDINNFIVPDAGDALGEVAVRLHLVAGDAAQEGEEPHQAAVVVRRVAGFVVATVAKPVPGLDVAVPHAERPPQHRVHGQAGRLLDVGCSMGTLMGVAKELGWQVEGVEPNPKAANLAREQGFKVHEGFLTASLVQQLPGDYQCVVMSDVIEHLADPAEAVRLAKELLAPAGFLLVITPNLESFFCRKFQLKPMEHLFLFNLNNLRLLLEKEGLEINRLEKTSRRRALGQLNHSTTELGGGLKGLTAVLCLLRLDGTLAWILDRFSRDELLVIARKT